MVGIGIVLKSVQVVLTACIAVVPLLYPKHSFFTKRAHSGIDYLLETPNTVRKGDNEAYYAHLEKGDRGFSEVKKALMDTVAFSDEFNRIGYVWGGGEAVIDHINFKTNINVWPNGILYVEYEGELEGVQEPILQESWSSFNAKTLAPIQVAVAQAAQQRAHASTVLLTGTWALLALILIV